MYPKNAASPQRVAIGAVVQISDGAVQASGVSVSVMPQGGAAGAGGGTIAYEQGIVHYVPTQAETNYASFILIAYKTGCIPVAVTIVTTASGVAGYAGLDWASINAPTTTVGLTNTTVGVLTTYTGNTPQTGDSFARIGATGSGLTTLATAANLATVAGYIDTEIADIQARLPATLVAGRMDASVGAIAANAITAASMAADASAEIADAVWDETLAGHIAAGSTGEALSAAGGAGDPWITALPGAYGVGSAGYIVGTNLNATVSSRASQTSLDTLDDFVDTEVAAIKAKTDNLPAAPAATGDCITASGVRTAVGLASANLDTQLTTIAGYTDSIESRLPAALIGGRMDATVSAIDNDTTALAAFKAAVRTNITGTVGAASSTTSVVTSSMTPAASVTDQFKGLIIKFDLNTSTAALRGQASDITASTAGGVLTVTALTTAPANGDTFAIL